MSFIFSEVSRTCNYLELVITLYTVPNISIGTSINTFNVYKIIIQNLIFNNVFNVRDCVLYRVRKPFS